MAPGIVAALSPRYSSGVPYEGTGTSMPSAHAHRLPPQGGSEGSAYAATLAATVASKTLVLPGKAPSTNTTATATIIATQPLHPSDKENQGGPQGEAGGSAPRREELLARAVSCNRALTTANTRLNEELDEQRFLLATEKRAFTRLAEQAQHDHGELCEHITAGQEVVQQLQGRLAEQERWADRQERERYRERHDEQERRQGWERALEAAAAREVEQERALLDGETQWRAAVDQERAKGQQQIDLREGELVQEKDAFVASRQQEQEVWLGKQAEAQKAMKLQEKQWQQQHEEERRGWQREREAWEAEGEQHRAREREWERQREALQRQVSEQELGRHLDREHRDHSETELTRARTTLGDQQRDLHSTVQRLGAALTLREQEVNTLSKQLSASQQQCAAGVKEARRRDRTHRDAEGLQAAHDQSLGSMATRIAQLSVWLQQQSMATPPGEPLEEEAGRVGVDEDLGLGRSGAPRRVGRRPSAGQSTGAVTGMAALRSAVLTTSSAYGTNITTTASAPSTATIAESTTATPTTDVTLITTSTAPAANAEALQHALTTTTTTTSSTSTTIVAAVGPETIETALRALEIQCSAFMHTQTQARSLHASRYKERVIELHKGYDRKLEQRLQQYRREKDEARARSGEQMQQAEVERADRLLVWAQREDELQTRHAAEERRQEQELSQAHASEKARITAEHERITAEHVEDKAVWAVQKAEGEQECERLRKEVLVTTSHIKVLEADLEVVRGELKSQQVTSIEAAAVAADEQTSAARWREGKEKEWAEYAVEAEFTQYTAVREQGQAVRQWGQERDKLIGTLETERTDRRTEETRLRLDLQSRYEREAELKAVVESERTRVTGLTAALEGAEAATILHQEEHAAALLEAERQASVVAQEREHKRERWWADAEATREGELRAYKVKQKERLGLLERQCHLHKEEVRCMEESTKAQQDKTRELLSFVLARNNTGAPPPALASQLPSSTIFDVISSTTASTLPLLLPPAAKVLAELGQSDGANFVKSNPPMLPTDPETLAQLLGVPLTPVDLLTAHNHRELLTPVSFLTAPRSEAWTPMVALEELGSEWGDAEDGDFGGNAGDSGTSEEEVAVKREEHEGKKEESLETSLAGSDYSSAQPGAVKPRLPS